MAATVLANLTGENMPTLAQQVTAFYTTFFANWQVKQLGPKPTVAQLETIHALGARPGKQALANAMALRDMGVTGSEIVIACGAPQLNKMRGFVTDGLLKRELVPQRNGHTVYKVTLTPKGAQRIKGTAPVKAEPEKAKPVAKAKPKAKKPKAVKPVEVKATPPQAAEATQSPDAPQS